MKKLLRSALILGTMSVPAMAQSNQDSYQEGYRDEAMRFAWFRSLSTEEKSGYDRGYMNATKLQDRTYPDLKRPAVPCDDPVHSSEWISACNKAQEIWIRLYSRGFSDGGYAKGQADKIKTEH